MVLGKTSPLTATGPLTWPPCPPLRPPGPHPHPPFLLRSYDVISGQQTPSSVQAPTLHSTHTGCPVCEPPHQLSLCPNALPSPALLANCRVSFRNHPSQPSSSRSSVTCCFVALMGRAQALALASAFLPALLIYRQGLSYSRCVLGVYTEAGQHSWSKRACGVNGYVFGLKRTSSLGLYSHLSCFNLSLRSSAACLYPPET